MNGIKYDSGSFGAATTEAAKATSYMNEALSSAASVKSSVTSDTSVSATVSAAVNDIESACSTKDGITDAFGAWDALLSSQGENIENSSAENVSMMSEYIKSFGRHIGSYKSMFGVEMVTNFQIGYNYVPGPNHQHEGGYVVYIPPTYNSNTPIGMSIVFHDSGIIAGIENHAIAEELKSGEYTPNSIMILPRAAKKAYDLAAGTKSFPSLDVQNWILELMDNIMSNYNVDVNNITLSASSAGIRGALEFARNNTDYFSRVYIAGTLNVYDWSAEGDSNSIKAIQNIKDLSDAGVEVNLYGPWTSLPMYERCENVVFHQTTKENGGVISDHIGVIDAMYADTEYLAAIGGMNKSVNVVGTLDSGGVVNVTNQESSGATTTIPTTTTNSGSTSGDSGKIVVERLDSEETKKPSTTTTNSSSSSSSGSTTHTTSTSSGSTTNHTTSGSSNSSTITTVSQPVITPQTILPENRFSDVIPNITSGELESMEISSTGVTYEINSLNNTTYEGYLDQLKNSGYTLSENNTWTNSNYKVTLEYNNNFLKLILEMIGIGV